MYYRLLQISEVTGDGGHPILARDVHVGSNKCKMLFILRTLKTHWHGCKPQLVKISLTNHNNAPVSYTVIKKTGLGMTDIQ